MGVGSTTYPTVLVEREGGLGDFPLPRLGVAFRVLDHSLVLDGHDDVVTHTLPDLRGEKNRQRGEEGEVLI